MLTRCLKHAMYNPRYLSTKINDARINTKEFYKQEYQEMDNHYTEVKKFLTHWDYISVFPNLKTKLLNILEYSNTGDLQRLSTGLFTYYSYKRQEKPENLTPENLKRALSVSWAYRLLETTQVIVDDIIDQSEYRYTKPTWWKRVGVEKAVLDSHVFEQGAYQVLLKALEGHPHQLNIINIFKNTWFQYIIGQHMDYEFVPFEKSKELFPLRRYKCYYLMSTPARVGAYLANISDPDYHKMIEEIMLPASAFICVQNDFWDVFSSFNEFKKEGNDIAKGRNTWLLGKALELASPDQRKIIEKHYAKPNENSVNKIESLYRELKLDEAYKDYTEQYFKNLSEKIDNLPSSMPLDFFHDTLHIVRNGYING